ncbi:MAG: hypothetical protein JW889_01230 [Verrucomicrobia bacterium]|nr:hypothetical protein [Verrucomicrobiota bacterium]
MARPSPYLFSFVADSGYRVEDHFGDVTDMIPISVVVRTLAPRSSGES